MLDLDQESLDTLRGSSGRAKSVPDGGQGFNSSTGCSLKNTHTHVAGSTQWGSKPNGIIWAQSVQQVLLLHRCCTWQPYDWCHSMFVERRDRPTVPGQAWVWVPSRFYGTRRAVVAKIILWAQEYCHSLRRISTIFHDGAISIPVKTSLSIKNSVGLICTPIRNSVGLLYSAK